jgi:type IV pilus assembly protein PilC
MQKFLYYTQARKGARFERRFVQADNLREAEKDLISREIPVLVIRRVKEKARDVTRSVKKETVAHVSLKEKMAFASNMEQCQSIDMGLLVALSICKEMAYTPQFGAVCARMSRLVSEGTTLHDAMQETGVFDTLVLGLVRAGEKSGKLAETFAQIKHNYRRTDTIRRKVFKLMAYPVVVMFVAALCIFFIMWKTVPTFVGLFSSAGLDLPLPTKILMAVSHFTTTYPYLVLLGFVGVAAFVWRMPQLYAALPSVHNPVLRLPIFGKLQKLLIQETFSRTFLNLQLAGLRIVDILSLCRSISGCFPYKAAIARAMIMVSGGSTLMGALEGEKDIFGVMVVRTIGFGEKSGKTEKVLAPLAEGLSVEIMDFIDTLNTVIEPLMTLFIGSVVLLIMLALFIPIFNLPKLI